MRLTLLLAGLCVLSSCATSGGATASSSRDSSEDASAREDTSSGPPVLDSEATAGPSAEVRAQAAQLLEEGELLLNQKDYEGALSRYRKAEELGASIPSYFLYNAAWAASLAGHTDASVAWLKKSIDAGFDDLNHIQSDPDLEAIRAHPGYLEQVARLEAMRAHQDGPLRDELTQMAAEDQEARTAVTPEDLKTRDAPIWKRIGEIDAKNTARLKELIAEKGWPRISQVGKDGARSAWLLVQHADRDPAFQREALTMMEAAVAEGEADGRLFAMLTDRVLLAEGKPQRYGTQLTQVEGTLRPFAVEDFTQLASLRAKVGLPELEAYLRFAAAQSGDIPYSLEPAPQAAK